MAEPQIILSGAGAASGRGRPKRVVVGRDLCDFHRVDLSRVSDGGAGLGRAARFEALRLSAFQDPGVYAHIEGDLALIWTWDQRAADEALLDSDIVIAELPPFVPEPALRPPEFEHDRTRLLACERGVEGQAWRGGTLVASRWWPQPPSRGDWLAFARAAGLPVTDAPEPEHLSYLSRPWARNAAAAGGLKQGASRLWRPAVMAAALVLAFGIGKLVRAEVAARQAGGVWAEAAWQAEPVTQALNRMNAAADSYETLLTAVRAPDALYAMESAVAALSGRSEQVADFEFAEGRLTLGLARASLLDSGDLVRAFENAPAFSEVSLDAGGSDGRLILTMRVVASPSGGE